MRAIGGLFNFLRRFHIGLDLDESYKIPILRIENISVESSVVINEECMDALQIFNRIQHPSLHKNGASASREGLSVFSVMNRCRTRRGVSKLKRFLQIPSTDLTIIESRLDSIEFYKSIIDSEFVSSVSTFLGKLHHIENILVKMRFSQPRLVDWKSLIATISSIHDIQSLCRAFVSQHSSNSSQKLFKTSAAIGEKNGSPICELIRTMASAADAKQIESLLGAVEEVFDRDESTKLGRFTVKPGIDDRIDTKKRIFNKLPELMTRVAQEELNDLDERIEECTVVYLPQLGYMVAINQSQINDPLQQFTGGTNKTFDDSKDPTGFINYINNSSKDEITGNLGAKSTEANLGGSSLEFMFVSEGVAHFKSSRTRQLDALLGDTLCDILDLEKQVEEALQWKIVSQCRMLAKLLDTAGDIDVFLSLARVAHENNYRRPQFNDQGIIDIEEGRHVLQELCTEPFIANSTNIGRGGSRNVNLITGPNGSGKSVYIKQVALIIYTAQCGMFVAAKRANLPIIDSIHSRLKTPESISKQLTSAFANDLSQVNAAVRHTARPHPATAAACGSDNNNNNEADSLGTRNCLVLLDEFGKGTDEVSGTALLAACLEYWSDQNRQRQSNTIVLAITHLQNSYKRIFTDEEFDRVKESKISFHTMDFVPEAEDETRYLFRIKEGFVHKSYAIENCRALNLNEKFITRSKALYNSVCQNVAGGGNSGHRLDFSKFQPDPQLFDDSSLERKIEVLRRFCTVDFDTFLADKIIDAELADLV
ncbi:MAG: chiasma assembly [Marteilia pararefringens]